MKIQIQGRRNKQRKSNKIPTGFFGVKFRTLEMNKAVCFSSIGGHSEQGGTEAWQLLIHSNFRYLHKLFKVSTC